ncbi:hypothetical protein E4U31_006413 [Claviceps sp. LM219 group G6]|nr:hypothetical protein E4U31_006413 [Claviceps sp. LM219 group G6]
MRSKRKGFYALYAGQKSLWCPSSRPSSSLDDSTRNVNQDAATRENHGLTFLDVFAPIYRATSLSVPSRRWPRRASKTALCPAGLDSEPTTPSVRHSSGWAIYILKNSHGLVLVARTWIFVANIDAATTPREGTGERLASTSKQFASRTSLSHMGLLSKTVHYNNGLGFSAMMDENLCGNY